jgi:cellulose synthase/poly-beta-1,6-N-acetylglucosamine synthase-like glycosyltransferase
MIFIFYIFAAILIYFSFRSLLNAIRYLKYFQDELAKPPSEYKPFASIIAPCKGLDEGLAENLSALFKLNYPAYEIIFVVDNENDPAVPIIENVSLRNSKISNVFSKMVIAGSAENSSQKVENLREAVVHIDERCEIIVFVDSDARPASNWLNELTAPLVDENIGASTGYRWFISPKFSIASEIRTGWNASVASVLGPEMNKNFCWGGSTAIRRTTFERLDVRERWAGTVSDDYVLFRVLHDAGLPVYFVPAALTASIENCSFREMLEFTTRQIKLTRVYRPNLWVNSLVGSVMFVSVMSAALILAITSESKSFAFFAGFLTVAIVAVLDQLKTWLRLKAVKLAMPHYQQSLHGQFLKQILIWPIIPLIFLYNSIAALFSRRIIWRGFGYEMISARETIVRKLNSDKVKHKNRY